MNSYSLLSATTSIVPSRNFNMTYILFDCIFILFLIALLVLKKKYLTLLWALFGGVLYLMVDFGIFYLASHTRTIYINGNELTASGHFWILLWLSFSYGVPNFIFIWMALNKDKDFWFFTILICGWWICVPTLSQFGNMFSGFMSDIITTKRTTGNFHWVMAMFLVIGYGAFISYLIMHDKEHVKENIKLVLFLNLIGFMTQFTWEFSLLLNGIRPSDATSIQTLLVNSCIETNSGMVYFYLFHKFITQKLGINELLKRNTLEQNKVSI